MMKVTVLPKEMYNTIKRNRCAVKLNNKQTCHCGLSQIQDASGRGFVVGQWYLVVCWWRCFPVHKEQCSDQIF